MRLVGALDTVISLSEVSNAFEKALDDKQTIVCTIEPGEVIIRSLDLQAKADSAADRALILSKFLDRRYREELVGSRILLRWDDNDDRNQLSGVIDPRIPDEGFYIRDKDNELWFTAPGQLVAATTVWTSIGKPADAEPPDFK